MADQVEDVKQKTDIVALISEYLTLKKAGRNYKGLCPFHGEKTPSFMVSPELQIYKCFGCSESGDAFTFLEKHESMDFYEALQFLANRAGVKLVPLNPNQVSEKERFLHLNSLVSKYYHYLLLNHASGKKALHYLTRERGLKLNTIKYFSLGFSPAYSRPLLNLLINKKKYHPQELSRAGLIYPKGRELIDRFAGRVIFPLFDHRGNTVGFAGRTLPGEEKEGVGKYINSPDSPVYHKSKVLYGLNWARNSFKKNRSALVVEGELDLISCWQAGIKNVVAIKGSALTDEHADLLLRFVDRIILALDADLAGNLAARRGIARAYQKGLEIKVVKLKDYKDPDEAVRQNPQAFERQVAKAVNVWDYLLTEIFDKYEISSGEGKAKISREAIPVLASISDDIVQAHYVGMVAKQLAVPEEAVFNQVKKGKAEFQRPETETVLTLSEKKDRRQLLEERLLAVTFGLDYRLLLTPEFKNLMTSHLCQRIVIELEKLVKSQKKYSLSLFAKNLPRELFRSFSEMMISLEDDADEPEALTKELEMLKKEISKLQLKRKMTRLTQDMTKSQTRKDFSKLTRKLTELEEK